MSLDALLSSLAPGGRDFERLCEWLLQNAPEYRTKIRRVWHWDRWPGRWGADAGIDLVAETRDGELWAVQAKHYAPAYAIKKADLDSFLSESSRAAFTYRLVIATTDHLGPTARRTLDAQEKPVGTLLRSQLQAMDVTWPTALAPLRPAKLKWKRPRPHQRQAITNCAAGLAATDRGQLVMACGTGKTLVAPFLAEQMAATRVLVLVPSLSLLGQTLREWATASEFDYLAVCSDDTVSRDEHDAVVASTSELGVPVTTDAGRIASFLRKRGAGRRVIFSTYQSSPQIAAAQGGRTPAFDLVIADEAHRCAGPQAGVFATVLDATRIKARKRLFMTATPRFYTGRVKREASEADWEVASMDEEAKFGPVLHRLSFAQAIERNLLSDYRVVVVGVTDDEAHDLAADGAFVTHDGSTVTDARTLARQIGLLRAMANHDLHRVVTFHSRIGYASRFASSLPATNKWLPRRRRPTGDLWTDHVSGKMTAGERDARLQRLKGVGPGERGALANARCLTEGVDVPTLDGVAFIDPRRSQVDVVQAVGRAIRKAEDKTLGTIVIPVLVGNEADPEVALASSEFVRVWEVVRALRDHDEALAEELDKLRRGLGQRGTIGKRPGKIVLDLPAAITADFARAFDTRLVETATASWEFWFGLLGRFAAREHHARVPVAHRENGYRLGSWVNVQRYGRRRLSPERVALLEGVVGWSWQPLEEAWDEAFSILKRFVRRERHANVFHDVIEDGFRLGSWVRAQRNFHSRGRLSRARAERLEALPGWVWHPATAAWEDAFDAIERYVAREGHSRVPSTYADDGLPVHWVGAQRAAYREGRLSADRVARLEALAGWVWNPLKAQWDEGYSALQRFVARENHTLIPVSHVEDSGFPLGQWVYVQRRGYRRGELPAERTAKLEAIPGWVWSRLDAGWETAFSILERFVAREHHARVPHRFVEDGFKLGQWIQVQRRAHRAGQLSTTRAARLEALPGWIWDIRDSAWEDGFLALTRYVEREGDAHVPHLHLEDGYRLGQWIVVQRNTYQKGELKADRVARLEALPGWTWSPQNDYWNEAFKRLAAHADENGDAWAPAIHRSRDGFPLGGWLVSQRRRYREGRLKPDQVARLEALPGWTWNARRKE